jgi:hypothetical protein
MSSVLVSPYELCAISGTGLGSFAEENRQKKPPNLRGAGLK